jgi:hypothetical protein
VLNVAEAEPLSAEAHDTLRFVVEREISETLYPTEAIRRSLDRLYGKWVGQEESIYYWREWREVQDDGTITMKARGYDQFGAQRTGWVETAPDGLDFGRWTWILSQEDRCPEIISGEALEAIREEHQRRAQPGPVAAPARRRAVSCYHRSSRPAGPLSFVVIALEFRLVHDAGANS